jgi:hypothetical protein
MAFSDDALATELMGLTHYVKLGKVPTNKDE